MDCRHVDGTIFNVYTWLQFANVDNAVGAFEIDGCSVVLCIEMKRAVGTGISGLQ